MDKPDEFIVGWELNGCRAIFEQDDATGYLYLANSEKILHALHVYNRKPALNVAEQDVEVIWTDSGDRCGVKIFGKLRGVIGINGEIHRPANVMDSDGIVEAKWRLGFDL